MATGSRINTGYNDWFKVPNLLPNAPDGFDWQLGPRDLYDPGEPQRLKTGEFDITLPTDPSTYPNAPGSRIRTYFDDFYNRIHIEPQRVDFGAITSDASVNVSIWNAYYNRSVTLDSIRFDDSSGLRIDGTSLPSGIGPLGRVVYTVTALSDGPALLDDQIVWSFDVPWSFTLPVSGSRVRLLGLEPAWPPTGQTYRITYSFSTAVNLSRSGKEQRIANRTFPRKHVNFMSQVSHEAFRAFKDRMWYWQHRPFAVPEIPRRAVSTGQMLPGEDSMRFETVPDWVVPEAQVVLRHPGSEDIRVVESVSGDIVQFKTQSAQRWPVGTRMHPGLTGIIGSQVSVPRLTNAVATLAVDFDVTPLSEVKVALPPAPLSFNGRELFLGKPNWAVPVSGEYIHEAEVLDYGRGPVVRKIPIAFGTETRQAVYLGRTYRQAEDLLNVFRRAKGRQGEFYAPTWEYDFKPMGTQFAGVASFRVAGSEFAGMYGASTVHKAMFVQMRDGTVLTRRIDLIQPVTDSMGTDSLITVSEPWDRDISEENVTMSGWLLVWRFLSDDLTVEWLTDTVANIQINKMSLEDLPVETV